MRLTALLSLFIALGALDSSAFAVPLAHNRPFLMQRAHVNWNGRSQADKTSIIGTIKLSKSRTERTYLHKVLANGADPQAFAAFAAEIRGKGDAWMLEQLHLAAQAAGGAGLIQAFDDTCGPTSTQAAHAELDPSYALATRKSADAFGKVDNNDPYHYNKQIATEQAALFDEVSGHTFEPTPRNLGGQGITEDKLVTALGARLGLPFQLLVAPAAQMLTEVDKVLGMGLPVVARVSNAQNSGGHFVVILRNDDQTPTTPGYLIFDPWTGVTQSVTHDQITQSTFNLAGWNVMTHVYLLEPSTKP